MSDDRFLLGIGDFDPLLLFLMACFTFLPSLGLNVPFEINSSTSLSLFSLTDDIFILLLNTFPFWIF